MNHTPGFLKLTQRARARVQEIRTEDLSGWLADGRRFRLVDVREDGEWSGGHIPTAIHLGRGVLERDIERVIPDHGEEIVLYCGGGYRSALAAVALQEMGYTRVVSYYDGWTAWKRAGLPVEPSVG